MSTATITIGPEHDGRKMSLDIFSDAVGQEGYVYELSRGVVNVNQVPNHRHLLRINAVHRQLSAFDLANPGVIFCIASGGDCKIPLEEFQSERHPDLAVYKRSPPTHVDGNDVWPLWIPDLVVEVVSTESDERDYNEKPEEYLRFGISEYWIVDPARENMTVLQRAAGRWKKSTLTASESHTTHLLPGFEFDLSRVFEAAGS